MKRFTRQTVSVLLAALAFSAVTAGVSEAPSMAIVLRPLTGEDGHTVAWLEVGETVGPMSAAAGETLLELASVTFNVPGMGSQAEILDTRDDAGPLHLEMRTEGQGDSAVLQWSASRPVSGILDVR